MRGRLEPGKQGEPKRLLESQRNANFRRPERVKTGTAVSDQEQNNTVKSLQGKSDYDNYGSHRQEEHDQKHQKRHRKEKNTQAARVNSPFSRKRPGSN